MTHIVPHVNVRDDFCVEKRPESAGMIIFGASGDLAQRKLIPSLFNLYKRDLLPDAFYILGTARSEKTNDVFRDMVRDSVRKSAEGSPAENISNFLSRCFYQPIQYDEPSTYSALAERIRMLEETSGTAGRRLFYLSLPPTVSPVVVEQLHAAGLTSQEPRHVDVWRRVILEKPFGSDLASSRALDAGIHRHLDENQIYRIDHYLGKETVQNIMLFRFANAIFEPVWNRNYIDHVQITAAESIGIEHRAGYYEQTGLLRDMFQNHLLQLLALAAMEPPTSFDANVVRDEKIKVLRAIRPFDSKKINEQIIRGQYTAGRIDGLPVPAYRAERNVAPDTKIETYAAAKMFIDNWRWSGVPFYIRSGKRLPRRVTEIAIRFKPVPHSMFHPLPIGELEPNVLALNIQPEQGVSLSIKAKHPGPKLCMTTLTMDFYYGEIFQFDLPDAYERLILDSMLGDQTLFVRDDWMELAWQLMMPALEKWNEWNPAGKGPLLYEAGTWGPTEANSLLEEHGHFWREP